MGIADRYPAFQMVVVTWKGFVTESISKSVEVFLQLANKLKPTGKLFWDIVALMPPIGLVHVCP